MCARLDATLSSVSGKRELAKAIRDIRTRWGSLTPILRNGRVCIDDNASERSMWPMTLVRKDWAFAGSESGGERELAIDTLTETATLNALDPEVYLAKVLACIADHRVERVRELLPWCAIAV